jgi:hypothetical protein
MQGYCKLNGKLAMFETPYDKIKGAEQVEDFINDICMDPEIVLAYDGKPPRVLVSIVKGRDYE